MTQTSAITRLESESIGLLLVQYAFPAIVSMVIISLYNICSSIFIGHGVGALALSGLAVTFPFMLLVLGVCMLTAIGGATVCSIELGAGNPERAAQVLGHSVILSVLFAMFFAAVGLIFIDPILYLFGASGETVAYAREYMWVILWGAPIGNLMLALNHFLRASGYPQKSMIFSLLSVGSNIALTPLFIFVFHWGMTGAGYATILSQVFGLLLLFRHFRDPGHAVHFKPGIFRLRRSVAASVLSVGLSPFLMNCSACLIVMVINLRMQAYGGDLAIGAYGIVNRLLMLFVMIIMGLTQGMQPLIGYNFGARRMDRVHRTLQLGLVAGTAVTTVGFLASQFFPAALARLFTDHPDLIAMSVSGLRLSTILFVFVGGQIVITGYFQSMGQAFIAIFLSLSRQLVFLLPGLIFLPQFLGLEGVWVSLPLADAIAVVVTVCILRRSFRAVPMTDPGAPGSGPENRD